MVAVSYLISGRIQSCGCLRRSGAHAPPPPPPVVVHGLWHHPLYMTHYGMMRRCYRETDPHWPGWGGRGIRVWEPWHDLATFIAEIESSIGPKPPGKTLDRIDNDGDYKPGNVQWADWAQQASHRRPRRPASHS